MPRCRVSPSTATPVACPSSSLLTGGWCRFDAYSLPDLKRIIMEHSCPGDTHADCPDYNTFSRFLNYAPPKDALIAKVSGLGVSRLRPESSACVTFGYSCATRDHRPVRRSFQKMLLPGQAAACHQAANGTDEAGFEPRNPPHPKCQGQDMACCQPQLVETALHERPACRAAPSAATCISDNSADQRTPGRWMQPSSSGMPSASCKKSSTS